MSEPEATGNPVFDYKAGYRRSAAALQKWLLLLGLALFLIAGNMALWAQTRSFLLICAGVSAFGLLLFVAGIAWGFHWRKKLRAEFRREYGPELNDTAKAPRRQERQEQI
ncbi:MAG TPA: hypothetical protein VEJ63_13390 [Planctomycetota bacterium]|nr:hypothetical protein [Planctomycetota bacterium]